MTTDTAAPMRAKLAGLVPGTWLRSLGVWGVTAALFLVCWIIAPGSVSSVSIQAMLPFFGISAVAAAGQTLVVMVRGLDMSLPGTMAVAGLISSKVTADSGGNLLLGFLVVTAVAVVIGLANGIVVAYFKVTPLVTTLAIGTVLTGVAFAYSGGIAAMAPDVVHDFSIGMTFGISHTVWVAAIVVLVLSFVANRTLLGRQMAAVGANERGALLSGIRTNSTILFAYVLASVCAAAAGVMLAGYVKTPTSDMGVTYLLPAIAAVAIGGTSLAGGRGRVVGSAVAALFLSQITALVLAMGAPVATQYLVEAFILALAILVQAAGRLRLPGLARDKGRNRLPVAQADAVEQSKV